MKKSSVVCPVCGFKRLIDNRSGVISETYQEGTYPDGWVPDYIQKCKRCKNEIGIKKIE